MSQAEIDALVENISSDDPIVDQEALAALTVETEIAREWRHRVNTAIKRLQWARENSSFDEIKEAYPIICVNENIKRTEPVLFRTQ